VAVVVVVVSMPYYYTFYLGCQYDILTLPNHVCLYHYQNRWWREHYSDIQRKSLLFFWEGDRPQ